MARERFELAREFIKAEKYNEARAVLESIDHPKAKEWLAKVDAMSSPKRGVSMRGVLIAGLFVLLLIVGVFAYMVYSVSVASDGEASVTDRIIASSYLQSYCQFNAENSTTDCEAYGQQITEDAALIAPITECFTASQDSSTRRTCLTRIGVELP